MNRSIRMKSWNSLTFETGELVGGHHLHYRNGFECARNSRETVVFQLGMLEVGRDKLGGEADKSRQVREGLVYPSLEQNNLLVDQ